MFKDKTTIHAGNIYGLVVHETDHWFTIDLTVPGSDEPLEHDEGPMSSIRPAKLESYVHVMATQWDRKYLLMGDLVEITGKEADESLQGINQS